MRRRRRKRHVIVIENEATIEDMGDTAVSVSQEHINPLYGDEIDLEKGLDHQSQVIELSKGRGSSTMQAMPATKISTDAFEFDDDFIASLNDFESGFESITDVLDRIET
jgi:hypothetical protein